MSSHFVLAANGGYSIETSTQEDSFLFSIEVSGDNYFRISALTLDDSFSDSDDDVIESYDANEMEPPSLCYGRVRDISRSSRKTNSSDDVPRTPRRLVSNDFGDIDLAKSVSTTSPGVSITSPGVSTTSPGVSTTSPGVSTTSPGVSTTSPGVSTSPDSAPMRPQRRGSLDYNAPCTPKELVSTTESTSLYGMYKIANSLQQTTLKDLSPSKPSRKISWIDFVDGMDCITNNMHASLADILDQIGEIDLDEDIDLLENCEEVENSKSFNKPSQIGTGDVDDLRATNVAMAA